MKKRFLALVLMFLLVASLLVSAAPETTSSTCGFWCKIGKFIGGDSSKRALVA
ncbi:TPA: hypothetical protein HA242_04195 [Candidatus Woesearchaeota archaeon]|nr:hypothetical protein [Candidatus Woesearchaeota archaeon]HIG93222.1 hypothetical protein [Candidatus Woesearchaeota archaeon]HIH12899.1 hypothetical protein [Candidatus Woesearchaeota archaeon]